MFKALFGGAKSSDSPSNPAQPSTASSALSNTSWLGHLMHALPFQTQASTGEVLKGAQLEDAYEALEDALIKADLGVDLALRLVEDVRKSVGTPTHENLQQRLGTLLTQTLQPIAGKTELTIAAGKLNLLLFVGVNGVGKTTMIGKLAHAYKQEGKRVLIAAGDTFRAAAVEQLQIWSDRAGVDFVALDESGKGTAAGVIYDALQRVKAEDAAGRPYDVVLVDTAGRLQNKFNLMEELKTVKDVINREAPADVNTERLLVVDATTGQNALQQVKLFRDAVDLSGLVLTKFDGSAKGGIIFAIVEQFGLPIKLLGTGEKITDWEPFSVQTVLQKLV